MKKILGVPNWVQNVGFCHFLQVASLIFLDVVQDCSLGQCLTSSRAETVKEEMTQTEAKMIFSVLMLSSIHSDLLVLCDFIK